MSEQTEREAFEAYFNGPLAPQPMASSFYEVAWAAWRAAHAPAAVQAGEEQPRLTEDQIRTIFNAMPGGTQGFCRDWGYLTFARAIEDALPERRLTLGAIRNSMRYSFLRRGPDRNIDYSTPGIPWVVAISNEHGIPTSVPCNGGRLDAAIDAAMSADAERRTSMNAVILGFGPQPMDFFKHALKVCGKDAVVSPDIARMAGANLAAGNPDALETLRARLEDGALKLQQAASPGLSAAATRWLACGPRGTSSNTIFTVLAGIDALNGHSASHPWDPDDMDRCLQLLEAVPELRASLPKMAQVSPEWAALIARWEEIEGSHLAEVGLRWTKAKSAPKTYALMKQVLDAAGSQA